MTYEEWEAGVPPEIKGDALWRVKAYRISLFLSDLSWLDTGEMVKTSADLKGGSALPRMWQDGCMPPRRLFTRNGSRPSEVL